MVELNCTCAHCGAGFVAHQKNKMYCSRKCNHSAWVARNPDAVSVARKVCRPLEKTVSHVSSGYCVECGKAYCSKHKRIYCSKSCLRTATIRRGCISQREKYSDEHDLDRCCKECGTLFKPPFTGGKMSDYCGDKCRSIAYARHKKAGAKTSKALRRARKNGVECEPVNPYNVFDRDKWRCQLCGVKTPKHRRGTHDDNAPELDHIIPLSIGGAHTYKNTQCTCRKCNGAKSNRPMGQMLLIG